MKEFNSIIKERTINKSPEYIYQLWTTSDGLNNFFSVENDIEIIPNGKYEIYFTKESPIGLRGSEGCKVLSFIPNRMFSFTWNTPPSLLDLRNSGYYTWVVITFDEIEVNKTLVKLYNLGYPLDKKWNRGYQYFEKAWDIVMNELEEYCNKK